MTAPGVTFLDHTADLGMDVEAGSLAELLHRSALGMMALLRGEEEEAAAVANAGHAAVVTVPVELAAADAAALLAAWLRELLFLHEVEALDYVDADLSRVAPDGVVGRVRVQAGGGAVREIKGVTYHALDVERQPGGAWSARVIFDV